MAVLSLKSFHLVFIAIAIVLTAGVGSWALFNGYPMGGVFTLIAGVLLILYLAYFARRATETRLR